MKPLTYIDCAVLLVTGAFAIALSMLKTPLMFWVPVWCIQVAALVYAFMRRDGAHWPSTLFGCIATAHVVAATIFLSLAGLSFFGLLQLFFGLLFVHGMLYLIAAKPFLIRRGYLKPQTA